MTSKQDVEIYLKEFKVKIEIFGILFLDDRGKNFKTLQDLDITPNMRKQLIKTLTIENYSQGPLKEKMHRILPMWVFGKTVKNKEVYIKVSMGIENSNAICISFHLAEHPIKYPYKKPSL